MKEVIESFKINKKKASENWFYLKDYFIKLSLLDMRNNNEISFEEAKRMINGTEIKDIKDFNMFGSTLRFFSRGMLKRVLEEEKATLVVNELMFFYVNKVNSFKGAMFKDSSTFDRKIKDAKRFLPKPIDVYSEGIDINFCMLPVFQNNKTTFFWVCNAFQNNTKVLKYDYINKDLESAITYCYLSTK